MFSVTPDDLPVDDTPPEDDGEEVDPPVIVTMTQDVQTLNVPEVSIGDTTAAEASGKALFTVSLSQAATAPVKVTFQTVVGTAGTSDYRTTRGTVTFATGDLTKTITIGVIGDAIAELDESFQVNLLTITSTDTSVVGGDMSATGTITDDDSSEVSIADLSTRENNGKLVYTVKLSKAVDVITTVEFATGADTATAGVDYTTTNGTLTFLPGQMSKSFTVKVTGDTIFELDETFDVTLSNVVAGGRNVAVSNTHGEATGTIINDDASPRLRLSVSPATFAENAGTTTVTATLANASTMPVTITLGFSGTALLGTDYNASSSTITIPAGQLTGTVTLTGVNDGDFEDPETVIVDVLSATNANEFGQQRVSAVITDSLANTVSVRPDLLGTGDALFIYGTVKADYLLITRTGNTNSYVIHLNSNAPYTFNADTTPVNRIYVFGAAGADQLDVGASMTIPAIIDGGSGDDKLFGGAANDILLGRQGSDSLLGRSGRDLLIGGSQSDRLFGESAANMGTYQNIIIGNSTIYDNDFEALDAILAQWSSLSNTFDVRVNNLRTGNDVEGNRMLKLGTVINDSQVDALFGGLGNDWYLEFETNTKRKDMGTRMPNDAMN